MQIKEQAEREQEPEEEEDEEDEAPNGTSVAVCQSVATSLLLSISNCRQTCSSAKPF
jgi:hypothetical protein